MRQEAPIADDGRLGADELRADISILHVVPVGLTANVIPHLPG
ncbi:MAG: hypothetical protein ABSH09_02715 [Bryobacteraceae bacterium]